LGAAESLFLLAPLVTIPLGLRLAVGGLGQGKTLYRLTVVLQPLGALMAAGAFALPVGKWAGALATGWLGVTACIALCGLAGWLQSGLPLLERTCLNVGLVYLPFGGFWFMASRLGLTPSGFKEPIVLLTAVHFHYAAFAAPILTALVGIALRATSGARHKLFPFAAWSVMAGPPLLAAGWALSSTLLKFAAAYLLAAGLAVVAVLILSLIPSLHSALAKFLLALSALSVVAGMCLVCMYAAGEYIGPKVITIPQMTVTHGVINCLGFTLCGLLAWRVEGTTWKTTALPMI